MGQIRSIFPEFQITIFGDKTYETRRSGSEQMNQPAMKPAKQNSGYYFDNDLSADFCEFFFTICLDQIRFMENLLRLDQIESRIDWYVETRAKHGQNPMGNKAAKLLRAVFTRGALPRGRAAEIVNMSEQTVH